MLKRQQWELIHVEKAKNVNKFMLKSQQWEWIHVEKSIMRKKTYRTVFEVDEMQREVRLLSQLYVIWKHGIVKRVIRD